MHGNVRRILVIPGTLRALGISCRDNLCPIRVNDGDIVRTDANKWSVLIMQAFEHMMAVQLHIHETESELAQASEIGARNFIERVEEKAKDGAISVDTSKIDGSQSDGLRQSSGERYLGGLRQEDGACQNCDAEDLQVLGGIEKMLASVEKAPVRGRTSYQSYEEFCCRHRWLRLTISNGGQSVIVPRHGQDVTIASL